MQHEAARAHQAGCGGGEWHRTDQAGLAQFSGWRWPELRPIEQRHPDDRAGAAAEPVARREHDRARCRFAVDLRRAGLRESRQQPQVAPLLADGLENDGHGERRLAPGEMGYACRDRAQRRRLAGERLGEQMELQRGGRAGLRRADS